jgi:hypothetical protein
MFTMKVGSKITLPVPAGVAVTSTTPGIASMTAIASAATIVAHAPGTVFLQVILPGGGNLMLPLTVTAT